ncbi:hypothetical protein [Microbacterium sp. H83]|uniref:hypothetical protein n=1 Tax=Microbacterium sp. H83 TaxID=1827324 RepID=UPI0012FAEC31|nr:hypothetical protein [Microbacterium sp. H83]
MPEQGRREHRRRHVPGDHEGIGRGRLQDGSEGRGVDVVLVACDRADAGGGAEQLEDDVECRLADRHRQRHAGS